MSLADNLERHKKTIKGPKCSVCSLIKALPAKDQKVIEAAMADWTFTSAAIARALRDEGHSVSQQTLSRHRKNECLALHGAE